ncbi:MAG: RICIN domain-containing protein [Oscillospiraceae bacterium]|jgi:uncharacterized repeat protein (TIGR02543 family)|nr:RICIN domain-containing protein [Oscillospiraceae bacterium]
MYHKNKIWRMLTMVITVILVVTILPYPIVSALTQANAVSWAENQVGKSLDYDGAYGAQCVDLILYYYKHIGVSPVGGNAEAYRYNTLPSGWQRITYYDGFIPQPGDIIVQGPAVGGSDWQYGHVQIALSATAYQRIVIEQGAGFGYKVVKNTTSSAYSCVIRPKFENTPAAPPSYPTPPPGFTDVTISFAYMSITKTIYIKSIQAGGKYAYNSDPTGTGNILFLSNSKGKAEEFTVYPYTVNGVWTGDVTLNSAANGAWLKARGASSARASVSDNMLTNDSLFRIYRNDANGYYFLRVKSTGNYMSTKMESQYLDLNVTNTQPVGDGSNLGWERFQIEVKPAYAASSTLTNGYYAIQHKTSGKYISAAHGSENGANVILYEDGNGNAPGLAWDQLFYFERQSDGTYICTAKHSGKALDVINANLSNGTPIVQWTNLGTDNQRWYVLDTGDGYYKFVSLRSGSCLDIHSNGTWNGTPVIQHIDNGTDAQRFSLIRQDFSIYYNANGGSGAPAKQTKIYGIDLKLSGTNPTKNGYVFQGWSENPNATSATYTSGANYTLNKEIDLYAVWSHTHTFSEWKATVSPTTEKEGKEERTCSVCGKAETRAVPKLENAEISFSSSEKVDIIQKTDIPQGVLLYEPMSAAQLLALAQTQGLVLKDKNGKALSGDTPVGSGASVTLTKNGKIVDRCTVILTGDTDGDGRVTAADARYALRCSAKLEKGTTAWQALACDADQNGALAASDARTILRVSAKLQTFKK